MSEPEGWNFPENVSESQEEGLTLEDVRVWTFSPERTCEEAPSPPGFVEWASPCPHPTAAPRLRPGGGRAGVLTPPRGWPSGGRVSASPGRHPEGRAWPRGEGPAHRDRGRGLCVT